MRSDSFIVTVDKDDNPHLIDSMELSIVIKGKPVRLIESKRDDVFKLLPSAFDICLGLIVLRPSPP